jgi:hypothetical protein
MTPRRLRNALSASALALVALAATASVSADSQGRSATVPERINGSSRVVVARAAKVTPGWRVNQYGDRLIVSRVLLQVEETLKGGAAGQVFMDLEGGALDGVTMGVSSLPSLAEGERAVFFLDDPGNGVHQPHLRGQGILKLDDDNTVHGSSLRLDDIRGMARQAGR